MLFKYAKDATFSFGDLICSPLLKPFEVFSCLRWQEIEEEDLVPEFGRVHEAKISTNGREEMNAPRPGNYILEAVDREVVMVGLIRPVGVTCDCYPLT